MVAAAVVMLLAACDGSGDGTEPDRGATTGGQVAAETRVDAHREPPAAPVEGAVAGGTVTVLHQFALDPTDMDPSESYFQDTGAILSGLVTRSLTQYVYDPDLGTGVLIPDVATDIGTPNDDFTEWTYTIRPGVRFEDGTEVTAEDVAYGIERSFDRTSFPGGPRYSNDYFLDGDTYDGPIYSGTHYDGVVVDGDTLTLKMDSPFPDMPYWAAFPAIGPIPEGAKPGKYGSHPMATGPYKFGDFTTKSLTLVRNDQWDPETDPGRHQYADRFVFRFDTPYRRIFSTILGDSAPAETMLSMSNVPAADYATARDLGRVSVGPGICTHAWLPDYKKIDEIDVRRAIGYAYPYQVESDLAGAIPDVTMLSGASALPPGFPGRQDYDALDSEPGQTDPNKARALLEQAGHQPGEYKLSWPYYADVRFATRYTRVVADGLEAAGFDADPWPATRGTFDAVNRDPSAPINVPIQAGWCADWPSGSSMIPAMFGSESEVNYGRFAEPAVDAEIQRIQGLPFEQQPAAWGALDKTIMTEYYPAIVTSYTGAALPHGSRIGGINVDSNTAMPTFKDIYVTR